MKFVTSLTGLVPLSLSLLAVTALAGPPPPTVINACYDKGTGIARVVAAPSGCFATEQPVSWNSQGPTGPTGPAGPKGAPGPAGPTGPSGPPGPVGAQGPPVSFSGPWRNTVTYKKGDAVAENGTSYIALEASTAVDPAADVAASGGHWGVLAASGAAGAPGPTGPAGPTGPTGPAGPAGPQGPAGTIPTNLTNLSSALSTNGGVSLTGSTRAQFSADCMIGDIVLSVNGYGGGALPADGRLLPIEPYTAVFSLLGTNFGGNGITNFGLPDLRAFAPKGLQYSICVNGYFPGTI